MSWTNLELDIALEFAGWCTLEEPGLPVVRNRIVHKVPDHFADRVANATREREEVTPGDLCDTLGLPPKRGNLMACGRALLALGWVAQRERRRGTGRVRVYKRKPPRLRVAA